MIKRVFLKKFILFFFFFLISLKLNAKKTLNNLIIQTKNKPTIKSLIMFDPIFLKYHLSPNHPEDPKRIKYIGEELKKIGLGSILQKVDKNLLVMDTIRMIHSNDHISSIKANFPDAYEVAIAAVQSVITAVNQVCSGKKKNAFCAVRPPGHHALNTGREEGFCYFNNIAIAAKYVQKNYKINKIMIVDWDYHHGNSTEFFFYNDPSVLFFSTHDQFAYPLTGDPQKKGEGPGKGFNINIHLPCGTSDNDILDAFITNLKPAADKFKPELILISAGFDSRKNDPLGCFEVSDSGFIKLTKLVMDIAEKYSGSKIVSLLEGGYNLKGNASAAVAHIKTLINYKG